MEGASKIVDDILNKFIDDISRIHGVDEDFVANLTAILNGNKKIDLGKLKELIKSKR